MGSQYKNPSENITILLDVEVTTTTEIEFLKSINEKIILDEPYEVYFESITTFNTKVNTGINDVGFLLKFFDLNIQNGFNMDNQILDSKKILIPNSCITAGATTISKGKKLNFICVIEAAKIVDIHFSLTNLNNVTIFNSEQGRAIIELLCIPKNKKLSEKEKLDLALYEHTSYFDDRNKNLIIDLESTTADPKAPYLTEFSVDLVEPLIIDRQSEIYLDSNMGYLLNDKNNIHNMALLLNINEFNMDNGFNLKTDNAITNNLESNKAMIPNENFTTTEQSTDTIIEDFSTITQSGSNPIFSNSQIFKNSGTETSGGLTISPSGTGSGNTGNFISDNNPFPTSHFIRFSGGVGPERTGETGPRFINTKDIQTVLANLINFSFYYIAGNGTNGGERPDVNENLVLNILDSSGNSIPGISTEVIQLGSTASSDAGSWKLYSASESVITSMRLGNILQFKQSEHSSTLSSNFDHYGIKYISLEYTNTTTTITTKPLKSTKYNYISTVNPKIIKNISGTITNLNNQSIVSSDNSRLIMDFLIKPCL